MNKVQNVLRKYGYLIPFFFLLVYFLIANQSTVMMADDMTYSMYPDGHGDFYRYQNLWDIFESTNRYYLWTSGRYITNFINATLLLWENEPFKILNPFVIVFQLWILMKWFTVNHKNQFKVSVALCALYFTLSANVFDEVLIWQTGALNYSWSALWILCYLTPFVYAIQERGEIFNQRKWIVFTCIMAALAGSVPENYAVAVLILSVLFVGLLKIQKKELNKSIIFGFGIFVISAIFLLAAPGSQNRMEHDDKGLSFDWMGVCQYFKYQYMMFTPLPLILIVLTLALYCKNVKTPTLLKAGIVILFIPLLIALILNTKTLYFSEVVRINFFYYLRMFDDYYTWIGLSSLGMKCALIYYIGITALLLYVFIHLAVIKNKTMLVFTLFLSALPLLSTVTLGQLGSRITYLSFVAMVGLVVELYLMIDKKLISKLVLCAFCLWGIDYYIYHTNHVIPNIAIARERNEILSSLSQTEGDVVLPKFKFSVHGNLNETDWDYESTKNYYSIENRNLIFE